MDILKKAIIQSFYFLDVGFRHLNRTADDFIGADLKQKVDLVWFNHHIALGAS